MHPFHSEMELISRSCSPGTLMEDLRCPSAGDMVHMFFSVTSPKPDDHYAWDFGDGSALKETDIRIIYFLTGPYMITLTEHFLSKLRRDENPTQV